MAQACLWLLLILSFLLFFLAIIYFPDGLPIGPFPLPLPRPRPLPFDRILLPGHFAVFFFAMVLPLFEFTF
jgi:hypothetical protein